MMQNEFRGRQFECDNAQTIPGCNSSTTCTLNSGEDVLRLYRMGDDDDVPDIGFNCLILACYAVFVIFISFLNLRRIARKKVD